MPKIRARGEDIRKFILANISKHPADISKITAIRFGVTRQAINKHLKKLVSGHALTESGNTRLKTYNLASIFEWSKTYIIEAGVAEDRVWLNDIRNMLDNLPDNVRSIWNYGFTEMFNNAIDHSNGSQILVEVRKTAESTEMLIMDNGLGIFKKIQTELNLLDERHALLELSKGKLTTDKSRHSGQGIFFTSRMFDVYNILSGGVYFAHQFGWPEDWILERDKFEHGTAVWMKLNNHTARTAKKIFAQYTSGEDFGFTKTTIPVNLAQYGNDELISRSQAKRLLARVEFFKVVILDFTNVDSIGQAFADQIFRVFKLEHPEIKITAINANTNVTQMIQRAQLG